MTAASLWFIALGAFPLAVPPTMSFSPVAIFLGVALAVSALILFAIADRSAHRPAAWQRLIVTRAHRHPERSWAASRCESLS